MLLLLGTPEVNLHGTGSRKLVGGFEDIDGMETVKHESP